MKKALFFVSYLFASLIVYAQKQAAFKADFSKPKSFAGMKLVWKDEFNIDGKPDTSNWKYENGFVRNKELQWYQPNNANCKNGLLLIEGRNEQVINPNYHPDSGDWRLSRKNASFTSASIQTGGHQQWKFGRFIIRARIDTARGSWPAIWFLGTQKEWPDNGEIDLMEFYRVKNIPTILANAAWGTNTAYKAKWNTKRTPLENITKSDSNWVKKFHIWRMDWNEKSIKFFLDDVLLNTVPLTETINADGTNPFLQPQFILLNLALGGNGGEPVKAEKPIHFEVDYVRVYQTNK